MSARLPVIQRWLVTAVEEASDWLDKVSQLEVDAAEFVYADAAVKKAEKIIFDCVYYDNAHRKRSHK
jgi:hypothetical protein